MGFEAQKFIHPPHSISFIQEKTREIGFTMSSDDLTGALLSTLAASKPHGNFLEIGTGTGSGTAWMLDGMDETSKLTSIDNDPKAIAIAKAALGADKRLTLIFDDALSFIDRQTPESFDLIFADSYPGKYARLQETLDLVKRGGFYIIDDMLPQPGWPEEHLPRVESLLAELAQIKGFKAIPFKWSTGLFVFAKVR